MARYCMKAYQSKLHWLLDIKSPSKLFLHCINCEKCLSKMEKRNEPMASPIWIHHGFIDGFKDAINVQNSRASKGD